MPDDKSQVEKPDRDRVSLNEPYEVAQLARKHGVSEALVKQAIMAAGPMRNAVEAEIIRLKTRQGRTA